MKILVILIDGVGDLSNKEIEYKTSLEYANIPNMDILANDYCMSIVDPVRPGLACGSDTAHLSIFGYPPHQYYKGRGAFETMGAGLSCNFAYLEQGIVVQRRADRNFENEGKQLCEYLNSSSKLLLPSFPDMEVTFKYATEHRCGIRIRGSGLTNCIEGTDPLKDGLPLKKCIPLDESKQAEYTANIINELSANIHQLLSTHEINKERRTKGKSPANVILFRGCGICINVEPFPQKYGMKGFMIAPTCIIAGLGMSIGLDIIQVKGATGDYHSNIHAKGEEAIRLLKTTDYNFGFIHIKGVDDAGHDKNIKKKVELIQDIDKMIGTIIDQLKDSPVLICITGDHSTPCEIGDHSCDPVPFLACKLEFSKNTPDNVIQFDEISCSQGLLGRFSGSHLMSILCKYKDNKLCFI